MASNENERTSMNTPLPGAFGTPSDPVGDGPTHQSTERPADAGHVWSTRADREAAQNGLEAGTVVARREPPAEVTVVGKAPEPLAKSEIVADQEEAKEAAKETKSNVGEPDPDTASLDAQERAKRMMDGARATDADNTPGPRDYTPEEKAEAKDRTNVPSTTKVDARGVEEKRPEAK